MLYAVRHRVVRSGQSVVDLTLVPLLAFELGVTSFCRLTKFNGINEEPYTNFHRFGQTALRRVVARGFLGVRAG
jgi:hypothetical protein